MLVFKSLSVDHKQEIVKFDLENGEYNVTLDYTEVSQKSPITVSFNEGSKGWVSFKSFIPEYAISMANNYYSFSLGKLWRHHDESMFRNTF